MPDPERPTKPPPRRIPSAPRMPAISIEQPSHESTQKLDSDRTNLVLERLQESEERAKEVVRNTVEELTELYERQLAEHDKETAKQLAERDRVIDLLRQGDNTLNEAVEQLRGANLRLREEFTAQIASAVTSEVSKRFVTGDDADAKIKGAGRLTQVKSLAAAVIAALVSSGALVQIAQSCGDKPAETTPKPGPGYGGRK